jgi:hypothetical protein
MSVPLAAVGRVLEPHLTYVDARWTMSYAAVSGQKHPLAAAYLDATAGGPAEMRPTFDYHAQGMQGVGTVTHPVFVWAVEWPITWTKSVTLWEGIVANGQAGVHYSQDILVHRPIVAGDQLRTTTQVRRRRQR